MRQQYAMQAVWVVWVVSCGLATSVSWGQQAELGPAPGSSVVVGEPTDYAAVGVLRRVRNESTQAERLAVVDTSGQLQAFLAPTARLNLRRYLGQHIGVTAKSLSEDATGVPTIIVDRVALVAETATAPVTPTVSQVTVGEPVGTAVGAAVGTAVRHVDFTEPVRTPYQVPYAGQMGAPSVHGAPGAYRAGAVVQPAQHEMMVEDEWTMAEGGEILGAGPGNCSSCNSGSCSSAPCGQASCTHCGHCNVCGPPGWMWVRGEYLLMWASGMRVPPLVTQGGATAGVAGVLGEPDTTILLGDEDILTDGRSGFRIRFGGYWGPRRRLMWEGEYFGNMTGVYDYSVSSDGSGSPALARPFFNINPRDPDTGELIGPPGEDSQLVSFPGILAGNVSVDVDSEIQSAGGRLRWNVFCRELACQTGCYNPCGPAVVGPRGFSRLDFLAGYRFMGLNESLIIREDLTTLTAPAGRFQIFDSFETTNQFNGGEVGFIWEGGWRRWTLEFLSKLALGNVHQTVEINGGTTFSPLTSPQQSFTGGLLAQTSNIGTYTQDDFGVLPELGVTLGLHLTPRLRATVGYTFLMLTPVLRPGDQIDLDVNPDLLPPQVDPVQGPMRPQLVFRETDLWANALNVGLDLRW